MQGGARLKGILGRTRTRHLGPSNLLCTHPGVSQARLRTLAFRAVAAERGPSRMGTVAHIFLMPRSLPDMNEERTTRVGPRLVSTSAQMVALRTTLRVHWWAGCSRRESEIPSIADSQAMSGVSEILPALWRTFPLSLLTPLVYSILS